MNFRCQVAVVLGLFAWILLWGPICRLPGAEPVGAAKPEAAPTPLLIDAAKPGAPISPYIYGQFIEHLGRCIYGGIWAEMLEDRKFFYPVGDKESPWKTFGGASVVMQREKPFVGQHTPRIVAAQGQEGGIVQAELGLRKGRRYVGHIWLAAAESGQGAGPVRVSLVWGSNPNDRQTVSVPSLGVEFAKSPLEFTAGADTDDGRLEISGGGSFRVGTVSLMPADNIRGMRADTLALLKDLDSPIYRWPGGNFVSGYNWKDGIGDRDRRPPRKNPAWKGVEHNDFGLDEFMVFCREIDAEPYMVVNSGLGDVKLAVEMLQYANGKADTPMGKLRAQNGHPEPYRVCWWGIGNEMYGNWQLGHMPLEKYIAKHNEFAKAMRAEDPSIELVGVGNVGPWTVGMLTHASESMDAISEHFYLGSKPDLLAHVRQMTDSVRRIADAHRKYRREIPAAAKKPLPIALDEWNYWYGPDLYGEIGVRYFLRDALGVAAALHEYARQSEMYVMANYAQTVNVIGAIKTSKTAAEFETTGLVLKLYRRHFGATPLATAIGEPFDAMAALSKDGKTLSIGIVNPTGSPRDIPLEVKGIKLGGTGSRFEIAGADPMAYNEPGKPPRVSIVEKPVSGLGDKLPVAAYSVTLYVLAIEPK
jgi:alpha-N-arabinofuranosidase